MVNALEVEQNKMYGLRRSRKEGAMRSTIISTIALIISVVALLVTIVRVS